jgi:hypothetical protein
LYKIFPIWNHYCLPESCRAGTSTCFVQNLRFFAFEKIINKAADIRRCCGSLDPHHIDANPDSTYHPDVDRIQIFLFDADPNEDPDPSFKK